MISHFIIKKIYPFLVLLIALSPYLSYAADTPYKLLSPIGDLKEVTYGGFSDYLQRMINVSIAVVAALAIIFLIIGGLQYVFSSVSETAKKEAKERITNAIVGLLIALSAYLLLYTINPDLIKLGLPPINPAPKFTPPTDTPADNNNPPADNNPPTNTPPGGNPPTDPPTNTPPGGNPPTDPPTNTPPGGNPPPVVECLDTQFKNSRNQCIDIRICGFQQHQDDNGNCVGGNL